MGPMRRGPTVLPFPLKLELQKALVIFHSTEALGCGKNINLSTNFVITSARVQHTEFTDKHFFKGKKLNLS